MMTRMPKSAGNAESEVVCRLTTARSGRMPRITDEEFAAIVAEWERRGKRTLSNREARRFIESRRRSESLQRSRIERLVSLSDKVQSLLGKPGMLVSIMDVKREAAKLHQELVSLLE